MEGTGAWPKGVRKGRAPAPLGVCGPLWSEDQRYVGPAACRLSAGEAKSYALGDFS